MWKGYRFNRIGTIAAACRPLREPPGTWFRCTHILVPTNLKPTDYPALLLALDLAAAHGAKVTVLHVRPADKPAPPPTGLDALNLLHHAAQAQHVSLAPRYLQPRAPASRAEVDAFCRQMIPRQLQSAVDVRAELREGSIPEVIAQFADEADVSLVVVARRPRRWWLPGLPKVVRRLLQLTSKHVVLAPAHGEAAPNAAPHTLEFA